MDIYGPFPSSTFPFSGSTSNVSLPPAILTWPASFVTTSACGKVRVPAGMDLAQTAKTWAGRSWAMVFVPVDHDRPDPVRILAHEAFHVIEPRVLGASADQTAGEGADLLDDETGRPWFRLELRALIAAVSGEPRSAAQRTAARDAVRFRRQLDAVATPAERARERGLDRWEGLAEYSGMKLSGATPAEVVARAHAGESSDSSFLRSAAYIRIPAYGYVLDEVAPGWRTLATKGQDPADALRAAVGETAELSDAEARYDAAAVRAQEKERHVRHVRLVAELRARFVDGPVIVLHLTERNVVFDPRGQVQLGPAGVVMRGFHWNGAEGAALDAPEGALFDVAAGIVRLPRGTVTVPEGPVTPPVDLVGTGWTLHLPRGWTARATSHELHLSR